ncbi:MAG: sulfotransferase family protein [Bacteroidota bacterium]|nr:sulfotransferase family protein [Bacteroidota bacterium]
MISHRYKCIFIHIPKCGGTSIEDAIWPEPRKSEDLWMGFVSPFHNKYQTGGLQHLFGVQIREEVDEDNFNSYFKFTITRNPWDKAISQYFYMQKRPDLRSFLGMAEDDSFGNYLNLIQKKTHVQWEPQSKFILDAKGNLLVDFVGRLENMDQDTQYIFQRIGLQEKITHVNSTKHKHYSVYYNAELQETVADIYREDIRLLNYSFDRITEIPVG